MNPIKSIRERLKLTQAELAAQLGRSQGNVAFYERGQTVPPDVARRLIAFARGKGVPISWDDVYGPVEAANDGGAANDDGARAVAVA